jgi:hypothetical protein
MRLTNDFDQSMVERLVPQNLTGAVGMLPALEPGEANPRRRCAAPSHQDQVRSAVIAAGRRDAGVLVGLARQGVEPDAIAAALQTQLRPDHR